MSGAEPDPDIFTDRGIPEDIWRTRPYIWWTQDNIEPVRAAFADLSPSQRAFVSKIARQAPGWLIMRSSKFPPRIFPEIRPVNPNPEDKDWPGVKTEGPRWHWHGVGPEPAGLMPWQRMAGDPTNKESSIARHIARAKPKYADDHAGVNTEELHSHQGHAKYVFPSSAKIDEPYDHEHDLSWQRRAAADRPAYRQKHVTKEHGGIDVEGVHSHIRRVKDPNAPDLAKRIDVHPFGVERLLGAEVIFCVLEGCLKGDAVLADGGAVFSVPSVTLWDCAELPWFARDYLFAKTVIIVPDSDWSNKDLVINQARICQAHLLRLGIWDSHVAAPPAASDGSKQGVDDFIGAGGHLEDLLVIDNEPPPGLAEWVMKRKTRRDGVLRDLEVLRALTSYCGTDGVFQSPLKTLARVIGMPDRSVSFAIADLEQLGAIVRDKGDLSVGLNYFSRRWDWDERRWFGPLEWTDPPKITLIPELRSTERPERRLGDLIPLLLRPKELILTC